MDLDSSAGDPGDGAICLPRRRTSAAPVELAAAAALRLAPDHLLASAGTSGAVPHPLRRLGWPWLSSLQYSATDKRAHGRTLGAHDARGARKVPPKLSGTLQPIRAAECQADGLSNGVGHFRWYSALHGVGSSLRDRSPCDGVSGKALISWHVPALALCKTAFVRSTDSKSFRMRRSEKSRGRGTNC